jgi:hypothetical protein
MISMWGREINSAEAVGAVARIGCVIFKAVIMVRKRWMGWRGEKGRGVPAEEAERGGVVRVRQSSRGQSKLSHTTPPTHSRGPH